MAIKDYDNMTLSDHAFIIAEHIAYERNTQAIEQYKFACKDVGNYNITVLAKAIFTTLKTIAPSKYKELYINFVEQAYK